MGICLSSVVFFLWASLISPSVSLTCTSQTFSGNALYPHCLDLPYLKAYLHFSYDAGNSTLAVVFSAPPSKPGGWIAWAINPTAEGMSGAQSIVAFKDPKSAVAVVKTLNISSYAVLVPGKLAFDVWDTKAEEDGGGALRIFAKVKIPADLAAKRKVNQVWQVGPGVTPTGFIQQHGFDASNLNAKGTLDLSGADNGAVAGGGGGQGDSRVRNRNIHGILNAVSWGFLFPVGIIIARYMRTFESADPAWFYLHVLCQLSAYVIGVAGWATGLKLGSESKGIQYTSHRNNGIALFALATIQMFALLLRPKKDHKYRFYWNIYHHGIGYSILILGIFNVFKGLSILNPQTGYKTAYILVISGLGGIALLLEAFTWVVVLKRKSGKSTNPLGA